MAVPLLVEDSALGVLEVLDRPEDVAVHARGDGPARPLREPGRDRARPAPARPARAGRARRRRRARRARALRRAARGRRRGRSAPPASSSCARSSACSHWPRTTKKPGLPGLFRTLRRALASLPSTWVRRTCRGPRRRRPRRSPGARPCLVHRVGRPSWREPRPRPAARPRWPGARSSSLGHRVPPCRNLSARPVRAVPLKTGSGAGIFPPASSNSQHLLRSSGADGDPGAARRVARARSAQAFREPRAAAAPARRARLDARQLGVLVAIAVYAYRRGRREGRRASSSSPAGALAAVCRPVARPPRGPRLAPPRHARRRPVAGRASSPA